MAEKSQNRYLVKSLVHAARVLEAFEAPGDVLRLRDVVKRTGYNKGLCFRLLYSLHQFALQPVFPLQDGVHFAAQALRRERGLPEVPYHTVRVWGTIGYIIPSAALYFALKPGHSLTPTIVFAQTTVREETNSFSSGRRLSALIPTAFSAVKIL